MNLGGLRMRGLHGPCHAYPVSGWKWMDLANQDPAYRRKGRGWGSIRLWSWGELLANVVTRSPFRFDNIWSQDVYERFGH